MLVSHLVFQWANTSLTAFKSCPSLKPFLTPFFSEPQGWPVCWRKGGWGKGFLSRTLAVVGKRTRFNFTSRLLFASLWACSTLLVTNIYPNRKKNESLVMSLFCDTVITLPKLSFWSFFSWSLILNIQLYFLWYFLTFYHNFPHHQKYSWVQPLVATQYFMTNMRHSFPLQ